jgi:hypothetical protein
VKAVNLNQLLFQPKSPSLSFYLSPSAKVETGTAWESFFHDMAEQLILQEKHELVKLLVKSRTAVRKIMKANPDKGIGFFISEALQGYVFLAHNIEPFCMFGMRFHVRPLLEEVLVNPEFILVNVSLYDINVYRADFKHVEILQHYDFDNYTSKDFEGATRLFAPEYMGAIPYKSILAIRSIARKVMDQTLYDSLPVVVTGLDQMKKLFLKHFDDKTGVLTHFEEDLHEKTCVEILERSIIMRPAILDYYSAQLKERLKRMLKSKKILTDLDLIVKYVSEGKIIHLVLPAGDIHNKHQKNPSADILNELAEEVMRQGGKIQFLGPHFFPENSRILAVLKGAS